MIEVKGENTKHGNFHQNCAEHRDYNGVQGE